MIDQMNTIAETADQNDIVCVHKDTIKEWAENARVMLSMIDNARPNAAKGISTDARRKMNLAERRER
jgi:hypothetical protein